MLILASSSPQRTRLLKEAGLSFKVHHPHYEEVIDPNLSPIENAKFLAFNKAKSIQSFFSDSWILGVDTLVVYKNTIIGKPKTRTDAVQTLNLLNNGTHQVVSGIALINKHQEFIEAEITDITFGKMTGKEIENFLDTGEWENRSGAFTIEKHGALYIKGINGDYYNVVGLPLFRLAQMLKKAGITFYPRPTT